MPVNNQVDTSDPLIALMCNLIYRSCTTYNTLMGDMEGDLNRYKEEYKSEIVAWQDMYNTFASMLNNQVIRAPSPIDPIMPEVWRTSEPPEHDEEEDGSGECYYEQEP